MAFDDRGARFAPVLAHAVTTGPKEYFSVKTVLPTAFLRTSNARDI